MTKTEIVEKIAQGEDSRTQFKRGPIGVAKLAAEFAAFSNSSGGVVIFGVGDDGKVVGLDAKDKKLLDSEISNAANDNVRPAVYPQTEYHTIRGKQILCVTIAEGVSKPYADKSGNYWMKSGPDKRRITSREDLQRILQKSHLLHADEVSVYGTSAKDIDLYHLGEFLERNYGISSDDVLEPGKVDIPQMLRNLGFADGQQLTLAGLMLFGKNPQRYLKMLTELTSVEFFRYKSWFPSIIQSLHCLESAWTHLYAMSSVETSSVALEWNQSPQKMMFSALLFFA